MFIKVSKMLLSIATISILFSATPANAIWPLTKRVKVTVPNGATFPACSADLIGEVCQSSSGLIRLDQVDGACKSNRMVGDCKFLGPKVKLKYVDTYTPKGSSTSVVVKGKGNKGCPDSYVINGVLYCKCDVTNTEDDLDDNVTADNTNQPVIKVNTTVYIPKNNPRRFANPRDQAQYEFNELNTFCNKDVLDLYDECDGKTTDRTTAMNDAAKNLEPLKKAADDAYNTALTKCRSDCIQIAINSAGYEVSPDCKLPTADLIDLLEWKDVEIQQGEDLKVQEKKTKLLEYLAAEEQNSGGKKYAAFLKGPPARDMSSRQGDVCSALVNSRKNNKCAVNFESDDFKTKPPKNVGKCEEWGMYVDAKVKYDQANKEYKKLVADVNSLNATPSSCTITDVNDVYAVKNGNAGCKCLDKAKDSCSGALAQANIQLQQILNTPIRNAYCATCGYDSGGQGGCAYGYGCGVSKAAQMISAIGGVAVPLGLGVMNLAMWNKGVNACTSMYGQALDVSRVVGLPPPAPSCGGMGGFGGGFGMGMGPSMYGPGIYGMGGLGMGMGMPGMMGMGGMGGFNPYGGIGGGISGGIGFNLGGNPMMGGMGGYNPMMGGMGGYNPMMGGMMGMQGNAYGVQQQMMDAQMRMQQMAAQNMVLQQSAMMGGMYGQMGGMYGMNASPYYNMGFQGGVNPMMNMGAMGGFTMNPWAYTGGSAGYYNPMMYGGTGGGISGGISGGINLGFNTGFNGGAYAGGYPSYGYNAYPSLATPPYAGYGGYNTYGYNAGYGPYGNTGYYPTYQSGGCGAWVGTPCGM